MHVYFSLRSLFVFGFNLQFSYIHYLSHFILTYDFYLFAVMQHCTLNNRKDFQEVKPKTYDYIKKGNYIYQELEY